MAFCVLLGCHVYGVVHLGGYRSRFDDEDGCSALCRF